MLTLSVDAIHDYQGCELFYRYRYRDKLPELRRSRHIIVDQFEATMKRVASFFFYKKQAGVTPSFNALLNRWEKLWFPKDMTAYDVAIEQQDFAHGNRVSYSNTAASILEQFHTIFAPDMRSPVLIDEPFLVPLGYNLRLEGGFDLVLRDREGKFTVIKWNNRRMRNDTVMHMAAQRIAFEHRNDHVVQVEYAMYGLAKSGRFQNITQPTQEDISALRYWATRIRDKDSYVPRRGWTAYCKGCPFDLPCAEFDEWPQGEQVG